MDLERRRRIRIVGVLVGLAVLASFLTGLFGMILSEKNREYFIYRLKNVKNLPLFKPTDLPKKSND